MLKKDSLNYEPKMMTLNIEIESVDSVLAF